MEKTTEMLLELLLEERVKRGHLEDELAKETAIRIAVENKNLELTIGANAPPPTPCVEFDKHPGFDLPAQTSALRLDPPRLEKLNITNTLAGFDVHSGIEKLEPTGVEQLRKEIANQDKRRLIGSYELEKYGINTAQSKEFVKHPGIITRDSCEGIEKGCDCVGCVLQRNDI